MVTCGNLGISIDSRYIDLFVTIINLIKIVVPIILIIVGMLDFGKAVAWWDKKAYKTFFLRVVAAAIVYFVIPIVELLVSIIAQAGAIDKDDNCISCFTTGECKEVLETENNE